MPSGKALIFKGTSSSDNPLCTGYPGQAYNGKYRGNCIKMLKIVDKFVI